jgi:superfamily II DNA or RNA helicase
MTAAPKLRPYQRRVQDDVFSVYDAGYSSQLISVATGGGKSVIFGSVCREHLKHHRAAGPVVLLAHRKELIHQAAQHFRKAAPNLRVEVVIGAPGRVGSAKYLQAQYAWRAADVLVTSPQTLNSANTARIFPDPSLVIADEAHHYSSEMFKRVLTKLGCFSGTRLLGVTATPFREDHRDLVPDIFKVISASVDIGWLINHRLDEAGNEVECDEGEGYLVPPRLRHLLIDGLDLSEVPTSRLSGVVDFRENELAEAMEAAGAFEIVAKAVISELPGGKGAIFAPTVKSSRHLSQIMNDLGASCGHVDGTMDKHARDKVINAFRDGDIQWLSNVGIISEGFDLPEIDTVVLARPTRSRIFFRQAIGRALRPSPGKRFATVFDVAGASDGHSLAGVEALTDVDVLEARDGESLTELLDRSNRERRGVIDRITAHQSEAKDKQFYGERGVQQIKLTAEGYGDKLPGLHAFADRAAPMLDVLTTTCNEIVELPRTETMTLDELSRIERRAAELLKAARQRTTPIEQLKTALREALTQLREDAESGVQSAVTKALVTGYVGTVGGSLFGDEDEHDKPGAPGVVQALKIRRGPKEEKPVFTARQGWAIRSGEGHLYGPIHGNVVMPGRGMTTKNDVVGLAVAVRVETVVQFDTGSSIVEYIPVSWAREGGNVEPISESGKAERLDEEAAYKVISNYAADHTTNTSFLSPQAAWRRKPVSDGARAVARRVNPTFLVPDNATAGFCADVILSGQFDKVVNGLAAWVQQKVG